MSTNLTEDNAAQRAGEFAATIGPYPDGYSGRGIVVCAGGVRYNICAWVLIRMLRHLGCQLPIELWYTGPKERDDQFLRLLKPLGVVGMDAAEVAQRDPHPNLTGWALKPYAILHSQFEEVLLLDADNVPVVDPEYLFNEPEYRRTGAIFWPDGMTTPPDNLRWKIFGVEYRDEPEQESGQLLVNKRQCWQALNLCNWYNEHSDFFYEHVYGDKDTFRFAWRRLGQQFAMPSRPIEFIPFTLCQHDLAGRRVFQHRSRCKWTLIGNPRSAGFMGEDECLAYLDELRQRWQPVRSIASHLNGADHRAMLDLARQPLEMIRVGYSRWPIRLDATGLVVEGGGPDMTFWWAEAGGSPLRPLRVGTANEIILAGSDGRPSYRLLPSAAGAWSGCSLSDTAQTVELVQADCRDTDSGERPARCLEVLAAS